MSKLRLKNQHSFNQKQIEYKEAHKTQLKTYSYGKRISKRLSNYIGYVDSLPDERLPFDDKFMYKHFGNYLCGDLTRHITHRFKNLLVDPTADNPEWFKGDLSNESQT